MSRQKNAPPAGHIPPWFRLYHEIADDPKLSRLSETKRWRFVVALVMNHRKLVPCDDKAAAYVMRISEKEARETRKQFTVQGLIRGQWVSPAFLKRQYFVSDHSTARVRAHRERLKNRHLEIGNGAKHVTVTAPESESESDTDSDTESRVRGRGKSKGNGSARAARKPALPLPAHFELTPERAAFATAGGHDAKKVFKKFVLDAKRHGKTFADADSAWQMWCERERPSETETPRRALTTIELALREKPDGSDSEIARLSGKSEEEVREARGELTRVH